MAYKGKYLDNVKASGLPFQLKVMEQEFITVTHLRTEGK